MEVSLLLAGAATTAIGIWFVLEVPWKPNGSTPRRNAVHIDGASTLVVGMTLLSVASLTAYVPLPLAVVFAVTIDMPLLLATGLATREWR
jgi:hypothetical protein